MHGAWKHCVSTVSLSMSRENGPITARYVNYALGIGLMSDERLCCHRGVNVTALGSNSARLQLLGETDGTFKGASERGLCLLCIPLTSFLLQSRSHFPASLYVSWPLSCHRSRLIGRAGGELEWRPPAHVSGGQRGGETTTQHLQSPELIYAAAVPETPSPWRCRSHNQHRLLPLLHASLAVVGNPFHWSLTTRFCIG